MWDLDPWPIVWIGNGNFFQWRPNGSSLCQAMSRQDLLYINLRSYDLGSYERIYITQRVHCQNVMALEGSMSYGNFPLPLSVIGGINWQDLALFPGECEEACTCK